MSLQRWRDVVIGPDGSEKGWILAVVRKEEQVICHLPGINRRRLAVQHVVVCKPFLHGLDQRRRARRALPPISVLEGLNVAPLDVLRMVSVFGHELRSIPPRGQGFRSPIGEYGWLISVHEFGVAVGQ